MKDTTPIFIVGSGRSGSRLMYKLLSGLPNATSFHEYLCEYIQPLAMKYYCKLITKAEAKKALKEIVGAAVFYTQSLYWIDSSNKNSWIIEPLHELFPEAKFIHIVRDGRKVVSSFFHKLSPEIYDDESVEKMQQWLEDRKNPQPPPEKKYWWNIPQKGQRHYVDFAKFSQFQRICYHWDEVTRVIEASFSQLPKHLHKTIKLEEITTQEKVLKDFFSFIDISYEHDFFEFVQVPQGVFFPMEMRMNKLEEQQFLALCSEQMQHFGYLNTKEYQMKY
jgi:hypothetical protein